MSRAIFEQLLAVRQEFADLALGIARGMASSEVLANDDALRELAGAFSAQLLDAYYAELRAMAPEGNIPAEQLVAKAEEAAKNVIGAGNWIELEKLKREADGDLSKIPPDKINEWAKRTLESAEPTKAITGLKALRERVKAALPQEKEEENLALLKEPGKLAKQLGIKSEPPSTYDLLKKVSKNAYVEIGKEVPKITHAMQTQMNGNLATARYYSIF